MRDETGTMQRHSPLWDETVHCSEWDTTDNCGRKCFSPKRILATTTFLVWGLCGLSGRWTLVLVEPE